VNVKRASANAGSCRTLKLKDSITRQPGDTIQVYSDISEITCWPGILIEVEIQGAG